jgi:hypothetical protein
MSSAECVAFNANTKMYQVALLRYYAEALQEPLETERTRTVSLHDSMRLDHIETLRYYLGGLRAPQG